MDKRKQKKIKRGLAAYKPPSEFLCPNCKKPGAHFVPPSFGERGFYACDSINNLTTN